MNIIRSFLFRWNGNIKGLTLFSRLVKSSAQAALEKTEYYVYLLEIYFQVVTEPCAYCMNIDFNFLPSHTINKNFRFEIKIQIQQSVYICHG